MVDESLRIQEAEANELEIADGELNDYISRVAQQNFKRSVPETEKHLAQIGSSIGSLRKQVKAEIAWNRVLGRNVTPFINVSDDEVKARAGKESKPIKGRSNIGWAKSISRRTTKIANRFTKPRANMLEQLRQGAPFPEMARQFSEASTASQGGDLGFVKLNQLPDFAGRLLRLK